MMASLILGLASTSLVDAATLTRSPGACTSVAGPSTDWTNATRAQTDNNFGTTVTLDGATSDYLRCMNYGFTIPVGSLINGIIVNVERASNRTSDGGSRDAAMRIVQAGTIGTADRSTLTTYTTAYVVEAHGGAADLWGLAWTPADINAANFGAAFRATKPSAAGPPHNINVDHIQITVNYTLPPVPPGSFNAYESTTAAGAITGVVRTRIAGTGFTLDLIALNLAKTAIEPGFYGDVRVELLGNTTTGIALDANNCPMTSTVLSTSTQTFAVADAGRKINAAFSAIANAWRDVRVRISHPAIGVASAIACSTDNFALRPASLSNLTASDTTWETAGAVRPLGNRVASGGNVHKAGQPFTITTTALNSAGVATANYDGQPVATISACDTPGTACTAGFGALSIGIWAPAAPATGTVATGTANYSEAGSFGMQLSDTNFADVDLADSSAAEREIPLSAKVDVGRFVPDHFTVSTNNTPQYKTYNGLDGSCTAGAAPRRTFTYIGQPFGWVTAPQALITARNAGGGTTANYANALWKLTIADISETYPGAPFDAAARGSPSLIPLNNGTGLANSDSAGVFTYTRTTAQAPFNANISLTVSVQDATEAGANQGTISTASAAVFNGTGVGIVFDGGGASNGAEMRYGRLRINNTYGSELLPLPVRVFAQYWNGTAFATNTADHCTQTVSGNFTLGPGTGGVINTTLQGGTPLSNGAGKITLTKPTGFTTKGSRTITSSAAISGYLPGAAGHETFGIYKRVPIIYIREMY